jgi:hypothetical protein
MAGTEEKKNGYFTNIEIAEIVFVWFEFSRGYYFEMTLTITSPYDVISRVSESTKITYGLWPMKEKWARVWGKLLTRESVSTTSVSLFI